MEVTWYRWLRRVTLTDVVSLPELRFRKKDATARAVNIGMDQSSMDLNELYL